MAYPFPRHSESPRTPQCIKSMSSPHGMRRPGWSMAMCVRLAIAVGLVVGVILGLGRVFSGGGGSVKQLDRIPYGKRGFDIDFFAHFEGRQDCGISSRDIYEAPPLTTTTAGEKQDQAKTELPFCRNRATLLEAMNGGGRHGFDAPFWPKGCHYRWYTTEEICMILERFDAIFFIGDNLLRQIYMAFNMLLRENIALGGLQQWEMTEAERGSCRCENQFVKSECAKFAVTNSEGVQTNDAKSGHPSPYFCARTPHIYLPITGSPAPESHQQRFTTQLSRSPESYKPIPIILSLGLSTSLSWPRATASMDEWTALAARFADSSARRIPFLWLGPVAAGHLKPPSAILSQGNNALWHYTVEMNREAARRRRMDALGLYNLTLQAESWDGSAYGARVALVEAMMVINWLSRLETT